MLARGGAGDGNVAVQVVGRGHGDRRHRRVGQQIAIVGDRAPRAVAFGDGLRPRPIQVAHGDKIHIRVAAVRLRVPLAKKSCADERKAGFHD
jgi:hypothetical protein